jgi:hypothetical protein
MCRRFDGYMTDSFTVTLRNNSWTVIFINNFFKKRDIREIIHLTRRMCRRFDGYVTDSFTVTFRNNSLILTINNNFQKKEDIVCG